MKLYNNGRRIINPNTPQAHLPGKWIQVEDAEGKKLLKLYPRDLTTNEAAEAAEAAAKAEREKLGKENAQLKADLEAMRLQLANFEKLTNAASVSNELSTAPIEVPVTLQSAIRKNRR